MHRETRVIRELPVEQLTIAECARLLHHCHPDGDMEQVRRRKNQMSKRLSDFYQSQHEQGKRVGVYDAAGRIVPEAQEVKP